MNSVRIIVLTAIILLSILPMVGGSGSHKPVLTTQFFSQSVNLTSWSNTITLTSSSTFSCSNGATIPGTFVINGFNLTEDLSGRDTGSTWVQFRIENNPLVLFRQTDLTLSLITNFFCTGGGFSLAFDKAQTFITSSGTLWRVPSSGIYTALLTVNFGCLSCSGGPPIQAVANETWTVTTIS